MLFTQSKWLAQLCSPVLGLVATLVFEGQQKKPFFLMAIIGIPASHCSALQLSIFDNTNSVVLMYITTGHFDTHLSICSVTDLLSITVNDGNRGVSELRLRDRLTQLYHLHRSRLLHHHRRLLSLQDKTH